MKTKSFCHIYGQLNQTGERLSEELDYLFSLGLTCDASISFEQAKSHRPLLLELQRRGGLLAPSIYPATLDASCQDSNWWKYSEEQCVELLQKAVARFAELDLGPLEAVTTYTPGNEFVAACRRLGIRYLLGFCAPTVGEDGGWSIAHYGSPLSAYFIGEEDFRKPENPGTRSDSVMMVSMELRNPITSLNHWNEGPWGPVNAQAVDRWLEPTGEPLPYLAIAEDWLRQAELSGVPKFLDINLQYFFADRCYAHNRRALYWLAQQQEKGRLVAGGIRSWNEQIQAKGGFIRQTTYWRGEMMGFHVGHRLGSVKDVIVDESLERQLIWQEPDALPKRWYDYGKTWNYPAFEPTGTAPASEPVSGMQVKSECTDTAPTERKVTITVTNDENARSFPVAIWNALEGCRAPFEVTAPEGWAVTVSPHPCGTGGALLLEAGFPQGVTTREVTVTHQGTTVNRFRRKWGSLLEAQTFIFDGTPYTTLVSQTPERFAVTASLRQSIAETVQVESLCGMDYAKRSFPENGLPLMFDGSRLACWHRFWGIHADDLVIEGVEAVEGELRQRTASALAELNVTPQRPSLEGYQLFGGIRDPQSWDRELARAAGEKERGLINEWFHTQRPKMGEVIIEAHPGLYLPRGSITKVLGHEFDSISCAEGYTFQEGCVDYPQSWDWGVGAWVQWRHLNISIGGLNRKEGQYVLHLHAFDPEERDICQRVHFFNPAAPEKASAFEVPVHQTAQLCVVKEWALPRGLKGRWDPSALCSILIPDECLNWPSISIWIAPLEKTAFYDWVAEKGAPGLFSHLWVTKR